MQVHPGRSGFEASLGLRSKTRSGTWDRLLPLALQQPEIEQHGQSVLIPTQEIAGVQITVHQAIGMQDGKSRQQLAQKQQHFTGAKHQLALDALLLDLIKGCALLPFAHQPKSPVLLQQAPKAGNLRMENGLHRRPELSETGLGLRVLQLAQGHRSIRRQQVRPSPKLPLEKHPMGRLPRGELLIDAVALREHRPDHDHLSWDGPMLGAVSGPHRAL